MKILKIVLISLAVLLVALSVAAFIFIKTFDINRFKPQIVEQAAKAMGRRVDFGKAGLGVSLLRGISLKIDGLTVGDDAAFGKGDFLSVKTLSVSVDVLGYLFRKQVSVTGVLIDSPEVSVIRGKDGSVNAQTIGQSSAPVNAAAPVALPALLVSSLKVQNATVKYTDMTFQPAVALKITGLDITVTGLSLDKPFSFSAQAKVFSGQQNVSVSGKCRIDLKTQSATISDLKADTDLARLLLKDIPQALPMVPAEALPAELKGSLEMTVDTLVAGAQGLARLDAEARLSGGSMKFKEMAQPVKDIAADVRMTEKDVLLESFSANAGQGTVKGKGEIKDYVSGQLFSFEADCDKVNLQELLDQAKYPMQAEGLFSGTVKASGKGFTPTALRSGLSGQADVSVAQPKIKGLNILRMVLDKLSVIPGLGDSVEQGLPGAYQQKLAQKDTVLSDIKLPIVFDDGKASIKDAAISSDDFSFKGKGDADFDGAYSLEGDCLISVGLSQAMVSAAPQLQYLLNSDKQIYFPLKASGQAAGGVQFKLNAEYIARKLVENQARQQIFNALGNALGGKGQETQGAQSSGSQSGQAIGLLYKIYNNK
jgi:uncharacterized protein involved in outer membrane biogenesis